jgi:Co/Zn/Cd efflux system component
MVCLGYAVHSLALVADSFHMVGLSRPSIVVLSLTYLAIAE